MTSGVWPGPASLCPANGSITPEALGAVGLRAVEAVVGGTTVGFPAVGRVAPTVASSAVLAGIMMALAGHVGSCVVTPFRVKVT